jgi:glycosyltransferase involved in cell wall biosynthesis
VRAILSGLVRVGVDATSVQPEGKGIVRVQRELAVALARGSSAHEIVALVRSPVAGAVFTRAGVRWALVPERLQLARELYGLPRVVRSARLDLVLTTADRTAPWLPARVVTWLFEIPTHRIEQNRVSRASSYQRATDLVTRLTWRQSLRHADRVVAASAATASEIEREVPRLRGQVTVVYPGRDEAFAPGPSSHAEPYLFHLGSSDPRDNTETVLAAYALVRRELDRPPRLVVAGALGRRGPILEAARERAELVGAVQFLGRVGDDELIELYRGAAAYVDASLFEGFGYQVLEAMACGTPVVAAATTSIPEVVQEAGLLCDPRSAPEIAQALVRVLTQERLRAELIERGLERARSFTWPETAAAFLAVLDELSSE